MGTCWTSSVRLQTDAWAAWPNALTEPQFVNALMASEDEDNPAHRVEIVQRDRRAKGDDMAYWRCSCGESAGGRWYGSAQEAAKAADRHLGRHSA